MAFRIKVLRRADRDVDRILWWLLEKQKAPSGTVSWLRAYEAALKRLADAADSQSLAPEDEFADYEIRQTMFKTRRGRSYRILFTIVSDEARLLHVRGPGQNLLSAEQLGQPNDE